MITVAIQPGAALADVAGRIQTRKRTAIAAHPLQILVDRQAAANDCDVSLHRETFDLEVGCRSVVRHLQMPHSKPRGNRTMIWLDYAGSIATHE